MRPLLALVLVAAASPAPRPRPARVAPPVTSAACRATTAQRCGPEGCEAADEGVDAEQFTLDLARSRLEACLYTDCFSGPARLVRDPDRPELVTAFARVRSARPAHGVPPPGSPPFPVVLTVNLEDGRFTAVWGIGEAGLHADFGRCELRRR